MGIKQRLLKMQENEEYIITLSEGTLLLKDLIPSLIFIRDLLVEDPSISSSEPPNEVPDDDCEDWEEFLENYDLEFLERYYSNLVEWIEETMEKNEIPWSISSMEGDGAHIVLWCHYLEEEYDIE